MIMKDDDRIIHKIKSLFNTTVCTEVYILFL